MMTALDTQSLAKNFSLSFYTAVANVFTFSNQLSEFYKNWGMQGRETKIHKFYCLILPKFL